MTKEHGTCLNQNELYKKGTKIGYIKINSRFGQLSYSVKEYIGGLWFYNLRYHPENIKNKSIIFYNVVPEFMTTYGNVIEEYNFGLIEKYWKSNGEDFKVHIRSYGGASKKYINEVIERSRCADAFQHDQGLA